MENELEPLRRRVSSLLDRDLQRIVTGVAGVYGKEEIAFAKEEINRRASLANLQGKNSLENENIEWEYGEKSFWFVEIWSEYRNAFKALVAHTLLFAFLIALLTLSHWALGYIDYPIERKEMLDIIHYYGMVIGLVIFVISFIIKLFAFEFRGIKNESSNGK